MDTQEMLDAGSSVHDEDIDEAEAFELSEIGSLYFGENPAFEAQKLLEQARELLREDHRIRRDRVLLMKEFSDLQNAKVFIGPGPTSQTDFEPMTEVKKIFNATIALSEEGTKLDHMKAKLELDYAELRRRKLLLQKAIRTYEAERLGGQNKPSTSE